jgi:hypothetical protein
MRLIDPVVVLPRRAHLEAPFPRNSQIHLGGTKELINLQLREEHTPHTPYIGINSAKGAKRARNQAEENMC